MELADIPDEKQTRLAATWLSNNAKVWYINTYKDVKPLPSLENFLKAFKEQHLMAHSKADIIKHTETIRQGSHREVNEYSTEFKMLVHELGNKSNEPDAWVTRHYLCGLDKTIHEALIPHLEENDKLDSLIKKATNIARNVEFGKNLDQGSRSSASHSYGVPPSRSSTSVFIKSTSGKPRSFTKLTDSERKYLDENNGCYWCRKINAGHMSRDCPDRIEAERKKEVKKESVSTLDAVVQSESDSEYSVPTINVDVEIQDRPIPAALIDTGSTVNLIDKATVASRNLCTQVSKPILLRQACSLCPIPVRASVSSKIKIPSVKWESTKSHKFFVTDLVKSKAILSMPFLTAESLAIHPALGKMFPPRKLIENRAEDSHVWGFSESTPKMFQKHSTHGESDSALDQSEGAICQEVKSSDPSTPDSNPPQCPSAEELHRVASDIYKENAAEMYIGQ